MINPPMHYFNEFDPHAAEMLRNFRTTGIIPDGRIDGRSIEAVTPADLAGYDQCHFFAGVGVWSMALRLAGWPEDRRVWTGSCPCQPFSVAGKGKGAEDERHLWPVWFKLIAACRPECLFGEQVASPAARNWYDGVCADLESIGYTCGAVIVGAHSAGADHQRQRLYWMAYSGRERDERRGNLGELASQGREVEGEARQRQRGRDAAGDCESIGPVAYAKHDGRGSRDRTGQGAENIQRRDAAGCGCSGGLAQSGVSGLEGHGRHGYGSREPGWLAPQPDGSTPQAGDAGTVADSAGASGPQHEREPGSGSRRQPAAGDSSECRGVGAVGDAGSVRLYTGRSGDCGRQESSRGPYGAIAYRPSAWAASFPILCRDGKWRRVPSEPAFFPLADGIASRDIDQVRAILQGMGHSEAEVKRMLREPRSLVALAGKHRTALLRTAGNAIVLQLAVEFITVAMEALETKPAI